MKKLFYIKKLFKYLTLLLLLYYIFTEFYDLNNLIHLINRILLGIFVCLLFIILILECITFGIVGTPNNKIELFNKSKYFEFENYNDVNINITELDKKIWELKYINANQRFDMKGWISSTKYIYYLILSKLILDSYNKNKFKPFSLPYGKTKSPVKNLTITFYFLNNKSKKYFLAKNYLFKKPLYIRYRFRMCLKGTKSSNESNLKYHKILINDCYKLK